jgi:hypothetical protein
VVLTTATQRDPAECGKTLEPFLSGSCSSDLIATLFEQLVVSLPNHSLQIKAQGSKSAI